MIALLILIGTSIWVFYDAKNIGIKKPKEKAGLTDMGPGGWAIGCLFFLIVFLPLYLCKRPGYKKRFQAASISTPPISVPNATDSQPQDFDQQLRRLAKLKEDGWG